MRSLSRRSVNRPRPVLMLETLEDRCVLSAGGLLTALSPLATTSAAHSPLASTLTSLVAVPTTVLSSVSTTVQDLGSTVLASPVKAAAVDAPVNLNVDLPFLHVDNLQLDVALNPIGSDQPLLTAAVGGKVAAGAPAGGLLNVVPEVQVGLGGSNLASVGAGTQTGTLSGSLIDVQASAGAGSQGAVAVAVNSSGPQEILDVPPVGAAVALPGPSIGAGSNLIPPPSSTNSATVSTSPVAPSAATFGASASSALLTAANAIPVDGGGGDSGVNAAAAVAPVAGVFVADGGAGAPVVARPIDLGGGTDAEVVLVNPDLAASGLTTAFQPYSLDGAGQNLASLVGRVAPQGSWLTRLSYAAPWLVGLIAAAVGLEIRRRRRASKAADQALAE